MSEQGGTVVGQGSAKDGRKKLDRELINASRAFAEENSLRSWWHVVETLGALLICTGVAAAPLPLAARIAGSILAGFIWVRGFILFHDYMHGAILRQSTAGKWVMYVFGTLILTPPNVWRQTHNYHHAHNAKIVGSHVGSFLTVTVDMWRKMNARERLFYRVVRSPILILLGYFTVFLYGMCISSFIRNRKKCWDSLLAVFIHIGLFGAIWYFDGVLTAALALLIPLAVSHAMGAYLFYAQHNFVGVYLQPRHEWNFTRSAIESSSYMKLGRIMNWFTGNIGFHHVHHLNHRIPFYRLPEALVELKPLHQAKVTTLWPRDISACLKLKVWDPEQGRLLSYRELDEVLAAGA